MKITQKLQQAEQEGRTWFSFEYFPPRTPQGMENLCGRIERMKAFGPLFIDLTWNAGGRSSDLTTGLVERCQKDLGLDTVMHLTCVEKSQLDDALNTARAHGCSNILALRGDPLPGQTDWTPVPGSCTTAAELVRHIRSQHGDAFSISVAGFPGGHPETKPGGEKQEMVWLKEKVDAGADVIFTQMFYDVESFIQWVKDVRAAGITVPIIPGIMPIQTHAVFAKWVERERLSVPQHFYDALNPVKDDEEKFKVAGTKLVADMCRRILDADIGVSGLHIYTLNAAVGARMLLEELELVQKALVVAPAPVLSTSPTNAARFPVFKLRSPTSVRASLAPAFLEA